MTGTILNVAGIIIGGIAGLVRRAPLPAATENFFKNALGVATVFFGLRLTWISVNGSAVQILKQLAVVLISLVLGGLAGRLLRLQKASNHLGKFARDRMASTRPDDPNRFGDGFNICVALFCAAPLGIFGSIHDGLSGYYYPLAIKAVIDGLAAMSFAHLFGAGAVLSAVPVLAFQGTITLLCARFLQPLLSAHGLIDPVNATGGLLIFSVALLILNLKKIQVISYLPSLIFAPLIAWLLR